jgi:twitching motility protein PilT
VSFLTLESAPDLEPRLRARLLQKNIVSAPELEAAARMAEQRKMSLEDALVGLGTVTEDQIGVELAEELSLPYLIPYAANVDRAALERFPAELLHRHGALPLRMQQGSLVVAISCPPTTGIRSALESACGVKVGFALAPRRHLMRALSSLVGEGPEAVPVPADPGSVALFYGHLAKAFQAGASEVRFEPVDGGLAIRYRMGGRIEDKDRVSPGALCGLVARARMLMPSPQDALGTFQSVLGGRDVTCRLAIVPGRLGDSVCVRWTELPAPLPAPPPPAVEVTKAPEPPARLDLPTLLLFTKEAGGSDLHLSAGAVPMVRVHGETRKLTLAGGQEAPPVAPDEVRGMILEILSDTQKAKLEADFELDFALTLGKDTRFRGNVFFQDRGLGGVFRVIPTVIKTCEELGLPAGIKELADLEKGLVLCTGPTGSGKSTTLAALVDHINSTRKGHILTIEDPIEFVHQPKSCMVNQREVGRNTKGFSNALRSALREDPDVILVGEMRDLETIALAITAAETGHLVFGTLHTSSAGKTVDRIINVFPAGEQPQIRAMLAESLQAVVAQVLLKKKGGKGRVAAQEILIASSGVRALIREGKTFQIPSAIQTGAKYGMQTLEQALTKLVGTNAIDAKEAEETLASLGLGREEAAEAKLQAITSAPGTTRMTYR